MEVPALLRGVTEVSFNPFQHEEVIMWMLQQKLARLRTPSIQEALRVSPFRLHVPHVPRKNYTRSGARESYWDTYFGSSTVPACLECTCCQARVACTKRTLFFVPSESGLWPACGMCAKFLRYRGLKSPLEVIAEHVSEKKTCMTFQAYVKNKRWVCPGFNKVYAVWRSAISRVQSRPHERFRWFLLSPQDWITVFLESRGVCPLTGSWLQLDGPCKFSIDRIDNERGYQTGNVHCTTVTANLTKQELNDEHFASWWTQAKPRMLRLLHQSASASHYLSAGLCAAMTDSTEVPRTRQTAWDVLGVTSRAREEEIRTSFCALYSATDDEERQEELLDAFEILGSDTAIVDSYQQILDNKFFTEQVSDPQDVYRSSYMHNDCRDVTFAPIRLKHKPLAVALQHLRLKHRTRFYGQFFHALSPLTTAAQIQQAYEDTLLGLDNPHFAETEHMTPEKIRDNKRALEESYAVLGNPTHRALYDRIRRHGYVCKTLPGTDIRVRVVATAAHIQDFLQEPNFTHDIAIQLPPEQALPPLGTTHTHHATRTRDDLAKRCEDTKQYHGGTHAWQYVEFLVDWDADHLSAARQLQEATRMRSAWTHDQIQQRRRDLEHDNITPEDFGTSTPLTDLQKRLWTFALRADEEALHAPSEVQFPELCLDPLPPNSATKKRHGQPFNPRFRSKRYFTQPQDRQCLANGVHHIDQLLGRYTDMPVPV